MNFEKSSSSNVLSKLHNLSKNEITKQLLINTLSELSEITDKNINTPIELDADQQHLIGIDILDQEKIDIIKKDLIKKLNNESTKNIEKIDLFEVINIIETKKNLIKINSFKKAIYSLILKKIKEKKYQFKLHEYFQIILDTESILDDQQNIYNELLEIWYSRFEKTMNTKSQNIYTKNLCSTIIQIQNIIRTRKNTVSNNNILSNLDLLNNLIIDDFELNNKINTTNKSTNFEYQCALKKHNEFIKEINKKMNYTIYLSLDENGRIHQTDEVAKLFIQQISEEYVIQNYLFILTSIRK